MSDLLFSSSRRNPGELEAILRAWLGPGAAAVAERHGDWGSLALARAYHDPESVLLEDEDGLSVIIGDPLVRPDAGPLARWTSGGRRTDLHRWLAGDQLVDWEDRMDGAFVLFRVERAGQGGRVVTDHFSFIPVYAAQTGNRGQDIIVGTHPDTVARAAFRSPAVDPVSAADLVLTFQCTWPHTVYHGVTQLAPGTDRRFGLPGWAGPGRTWWRPGEGNPFRSRREAIHALRGALRHSVARGSEDGPQVGVLLSGGEDSRAVLGAVPAGREVLAATFADWDGSREVRIARAVARSHSATLCVGLREPDHYLAHFSDTVRMIGSQHQVLDVHSYGFHDRLGLRDLPVILGGFSADTLLKARYARARRPLESPLRLTGLRDDVLDAVRSRREVYHRWLAEFRPDTAPEWMVSYPFSSRKHGGHWHGNRRLFRTHEAFHGADVLRIAAALPTDWKAGGWLFRSAMQPFLRKTWHVPHSNGRLPYFGPAVNGLAIPAVSVGRAVRAVLTGQLGARHDPWPDWRQMPDQPQAVAIRRASPVEGSPLAEMFQRPTATGNGEALAGWPAASRMMLLQLAVVVGAAR